MPTSSALEAASHHHYTIIILFVIGYMLHVGLQVDAIARAKNNPLNLRRQILKQNGIRLAARFFASLLIFFGVWKNPSLIPTIFSYAGINLNATATAILTLPMSGPLAGMMGLGVDSILAYIPGLKNIVPAIEYVQTVRETTETTKTLSVSTDMKPDPGAAK